MSATTFLGREKDYATGQSLASTEYNALVVDVEQLYGGLSSVTHDDSASLNLSDAQDEPKFIVIGGALTAARDVVLRSTVTGLWWWVQNNTTGGFAVTFKGGSGTGVVVQPGGKVLIYWDGTNMSQLTPPYWLTATATWDPASVADGAVVSTTVTVTGAAVGEPCVAGLTTMTTTNMTITAYVSAANTVTVVIFNKSGGAVDLGSGTLRVAVQKFT
jgi:hypothetical protein